MIKKCTYRLLICWTLLLFSHQLSYAQTLAAIPDSNFKNVLIARYPSLVQNDSLIIAQAQALTGTLNISHSNIHDVGNLMLYFTNITELECSSNFISDIAYISSLAPSIRSLHLEYNQFTSVPDLSSLTNLEVLRVSFNPLTSFPDLPNNPQLREIQAQGCTLEVLPDLSTNLPNLVIFNVNDNELTSIPQLTSSTKLSMLVASNNNITHLPDLSTNNKINYIDFSNNELTEVQQLAFMDTLLTCYMVHNKIKILPTFSSPNIETINFNNNLIETLPNLSSLPASCSLDVSYNQLSFQDLVPNTSLPGFEGLRKFSPQKPIDLWRTYRVKENRSYTFFLPIDDDIPNLSFKWFKNGVDTVTLASSSMMFTPVLPNDAGVYTLQITHIGSPASLNSITIHVNFDTLIVEPCFQVAASPVSEVIDGTCSMPGKITVSTNNISGGTPPYDFKLKPADSNQLISSLDTVFTGLKDSGYSLFINDQNGCTEEYHAPPLYYVTYEAGIHHSTPPAMFYLLQEKDCEKNIFTPDGDGVNDSYYIEKPGSVKIYNSSGLLVKELTAPVFWDGSDASGNVVPGYYVIQHKDSYTTVTVVY